MQYTETQLTKLIAEVEKEFTAHLAKAESGELESLSKSEKSEEKKPEHKHEEEHQEPKEEKHSEGKEKHSEKGEEKHEPKEEMHSPEQHAGHDYDEEDMAHMKNMYMSMSEPELKAHHDCIASLMKCSPDMMGKSEEEKSPLDAKPVDKGAPMFADKKDGGVQEAQPGSKPSESAHDRRNGGEIDQQEPKDVPGAKSPASKSDSSQMHKSENVEVELLKSELTTTSNKYEELKKNFDAVAAILTKLVDKKEAPAGKAITSLEAIEKSEGSKSEEKTFTKAEIHSVLVKRSSEPSLSKSDREAINTYYDKGQVDIKGISHLLK